MAAHELEAVADAIVANDKGILAADESTGTIKKRFDSIGVESTEENRRAYRNLLFTTPGMEEFIGGVILYDETIRQRADDGTPFAELLVLAGVVPGIKVDTGAHDLALHPGEKVTEGSTAARALQGVPAARCAVRQVAGRDHDRRGHPHRRLHSRERARAGAVRRDLPGAGSAADRGAGGPMDADNSIERCYDATARTLHAVFDELFGRRVDVTGTLLKPNMVIAARAAPSRRTRGGLPS